MVPTRPADKTHHSTDISTLCNDEDETVDDAFWSVSDVEWPGMTKSHRTRCGGRTWPKGSRKWKTRFVRFHEDPCDYVNDEANDLKFLVLTTVRT